MKFILRLLLSALAVVILAKILPGVHVETYVIAIIVAVVLSLLDVLVKPLMIILTLPVTILTLGLFLRYSSSLSFRLSDPRTFPAGNQRTNHFAGRFFGIRIFCGWILVGPAVLPLAIPASILFICFPQGQL